MILGEAIGQAMRAAFDRPIDDSTVEFVKLLQEADNDDLVVLSDYITDSGRGRLMLDGVACRRLAQCALDRKFEDTDRLLVAKEISAFGGNTLMNIVRGGGVEYVELVRDVADHLKVPYSKEARPELIETAILQKLFNDALQMMSDEERKVVLEDMNLGELVGMGPAAIGAAIAAGRLAGFTTYKMATIVANAIAKALLGRGLPFAAGAVIGRGLNLMLGPVGLILTGLWTVADLASPAYRVTVPCIVQIAYMREKASAKADTHGCPKCNTPYAQGAKFCSECGVALGER
ncbi:ubiquinol-cytochrome C chaperone family protein [Paraburkholderia sp. SIMBA_049]